MHTLNHAGAISLAIPSLFSTAVWNRWTGLLDWNTGLEYWNGLNCYKTPFCDMTAFQKVVTHSVLSLTSSMPH